ncbi:hypothetical protein CEXT_469341 [Caerostris extrusa]|uniref:Uncharacterized protein n=1 Tax=Caerostris extrusa TaxID=172846 RepID=A0AAV4WT98_CAEEX|nr:hypothetical protein CEXT_469341 [Caerostris extrusa]
MRSNYNKHFMKLPFCYIKKEEKDLTVDFYDFFKNHCCWFHVTSLIFKGGRSRNGLSHLFRAMAKEKPLIFNKRSGAEREEGLSSACAAKRRTCSRRGSASCPWNVISLPFLRVQRGKVIAGHLLGSHDPPHSCRCLQEFN